MQTRHRRPGHRQRTCKRKGIYATIASLLGIMTYIALRFRLSFGVGAAIASVHDVLVTLSILTLLRLRAVAERHRGDPDADRLRRERPDRRLRSRAREPPHEPARADGHGHQPSVNQTLPRTVITAGVTFLAVLALYLFGGDVLEGFAFTMLVGIVTSTYSTIYIASAVAVVLSPARMRTGTPGAAARQAVVGGSKPRGRRAP